MSKTSTLLAVALVLSFMLITSAARPDSTFAGESAVRIQPEGIEVNESCDEGKEDCLMKRTLAAHVDYIYTQKDHKP